MPSLTQSRLAQLLSPYSSEQFLSEIWTQKSLYVPNPASGLGAGSNTKPVSKFADLFSWQHLNQLLNYHEFDYPTLRLAVNGEVLPATENANFVQHCQAGATLILDRVHKLIPELGELCGQLRYELGHPMQINLYSSGPGKQGFRCHYDTHEVFILPIAGCKEWHVFEPTFAYPLVDQKSARLSPPATEPYLSCVLEPGDLLYIPRGHWHYAIALDQQPSLHLTLGALCKTGIDYLNWLLADLKQQEVWRQNLPLLDSPTADTHFASLMQQLHEYLTQQQQPAAYRRYYASLEQPIASSAFPQQAGFQIFEQGLETQFRRPKYQHVYAEPLQEPLQEHQVEPLSETPSGYRIIAGSKQITLRGIPQSFIDQWLQHERFTGQDVLDWLPGFDWTAEIMPLLTHLVKEGVILVEQSEAS
jgi:ribosomal protein L16 Arg81 hydroxylase